MPQEKLGESHNFGQFVYRLSDYEIFKPRTLFWEWLFLGQSPLMSFFRSTPEGAMVFTSFPTLKIYSDSNFHFGSVEFLRTEDVGSFEAIDLECIGYVLAWSVWFGVTDLHSENMAIGRKDKSFIFCPLDIEVVFENILLPSQTHLLPSKAFSENDCGLCALLKSLNEPLSLNQIISICSGFLLGTLYFENNVNQISKIIYEQAEQFQPKIRKLLRPTRDYLDALVDFGKVKRASFLTSELQQLERRDVPYYFRNHNDGDIYYYNNPNISIKDDLDEISKQLVVHESILIDKNLSFMNRNSEAIIKYGLSQISRLYKGQEKQVANDLMQIWIVNQEIFIQAKNGIKLRVKQDEVA